MRTVLGPLIAAAVLIAPAVPSLASAASTAAVPTRHLSASGGTIKWPVMVHNATTCIWSSSPQVAGFDGTVKCTNGRVVRPATFKANTSTGAKDYTLNLVMRGTTRTVDHLKVVEAGKPTTTSTTTTSTTTTSTTTTTLPPASSPGWTSPNWSGYALTGESGGYQAISADWTVPTLDCASIPDGATSDWVGVNGASDAHGLFQDGTSSNCVSGQQSNYAWWTDEAESYSNQNLFTVSPGDVISAEVWQETSGLWAYYVSDLTSGSSSSASEPFSGPGTTAEWIAEDPGDPTTQGLYPLGDFRTVTFTDLGLIVPSGSWTLPPYSDAVEMVASDGSVEALPSPIQGSGTSASFTVTYEPPGAMGSTAGTAAMKHSQSTFVAPVPRMVPQHQAGQPGSRSIPRPCGVTLLPNVH